VGRASLRLLPISRVLQMIDPKRFDSFASGFQHVITALGIVVGGIWVLYTFWGQHVIQKASLDVAKTELEIRKIEQDSLQQPVLHMTIRPGIIRDDGYPISMTALIRNDGKLALSYEDCHILLRQLLDEKGSQADNVQPLRITAAILENNGTFSDMPLRVLRAGQERNLAFVLPKLAAGTYFVELRTEYNGMQIINGQFEPSSDTTIDAVEQTVLKVPEKMGSEAPLSRPSKE
jgi:hypothetical protein